MDEKWREGFARIDATEHLTHRGKYAAEQRYMRIKLDAYEDRIEELERENGRQRKALNWLVRIPNDNGFELYRWQDEFKDLIDDLGEE